MVGRGWSRKPATASIYQGLWILILIATIKIFFLFPKRTLFCRNVSADLTMNQKINSKQQALLKNVFNQSVKKLVPAKDHEQHSNEHSILISTEHSI